MWKREKGRREGSIIARLLEIRFCGLGECREDVCVWPPKFCARVSPPGLNSGERSYPKRTKTRKRVGVQTRKVKEWRHAQQCPREWALLMRVLSMSDGLSVLFWCSVG